MENRTAIIAAILSLIGAFLIFINVLMIAANGAPIMISPFSVESIEQLLNNGNPLWFRLSFGIPSFVEGPLVLVWLVVSVINLLSAVFIYLNLEKPDLPSLFVLVTSLFSFLAGGGFIIGSILGVMGSCFGLQWREPWQETLLGRFIKVAKLDSKVFSSIKEKPGLHVAVFTIMLINFLSGLGCSLYVYNVNKILNSPLDAEKILLLGEVLFDVSVLNVPIIYIGLSVMKWILLSTIIYIIGARLIGTKAEFHTIACLTAYAYVPVCLQIFLPFVFLNVPYLTVHWPLSVFFFTNIWMILALLMGVKQLFDLTTLKAIGMVALAGSIYWLVTYKIILSTLFDSIPGIFLDINPNEFVLFLLSLAAILAVISGTFKK